MKTFQEFTKITEEAKKTLKDIVGTGVPSEKPTSTSSLTGKTSTSTVDYAIPYYPAKSPVIRPLNKATYKGRVNTYKGNKNKEVHIAPEYTVKTNKYSGYT